MGLISHMVGVDPSPMLYTGLSDAFPEVTFGWDMPIDKDPACLMALEPGRYPTAVTQTMMLRLTVIKQNPDGTGDWQAASRLSRQIIRWLRDHATCTPLCGVEVESGPLRTMDDRLGCETAYTTVSLTVRAD